MLAVAEFGTAVCAHHQRLRLGERFVGSETVVDVHAAFIGDHIGALAAADQRRVEPFAVDETVHAHSGVRMLVQTAQNLGGVVDGVVAHPRACGMCGYAVRDHVEADRAVAAAFNAA